MAQYRQSGHYNANGTASDHVSIGILRSSPPHQQYNKPIRGRRLARSDKTSHRSSSFSIGFGTLVVIVVLSLVLVVTVLAYSYVSSYTKGSYNNMPKSRSVSYPCDSDVAGAELDDRVVDNDDELKNDVDFLTNVTRTSDVRVLGFGQGSAHGRDSRYWDKDDRRRDGDYNEDDVDHDSSEAKDESAQKGYDLVKVNNGKDKMSQDETSNGSYQRGTVLYNEDGRKELKMYEKEYEASLKKAGQSSHEDEIKHQALDDENHGEQTEGIDTDNEYNDGIDSHDPHMEDYGNSDLDNGDQDGRRELSNLSNAETRYQNISKDDHQFSESIPDKSLNTITMDTADGNYRHGRSSGSQYTTKSRSDTKRKSKRRRGCEIKFLNSTTQLVEPFESRKFARFSLQYNEKEEKPDGNEQWEPRFAGHQSLEEREESFLVHDQKINCGFVKGPEGSPSTGFELSEDDASYVSRCHIAVISCIFGNSDRLRSPPTKTVTRLSRKNVCFVMFMDELTLQTLSSEGHVPDTAGFIGFWKVVVVKNLPYTDMRRVGKIPKLLPQRLFPSARYSIWLDSKLRLQLDPLLVLEYFLWRKGYEYAISNHYDRHCVWEEVAQNKRLNKYNHTVIDQQFTFYQNDGLKKFNASDPNKLLPSNVPEGSLIVRAHTPMSNLFSCLWFNEVERFTPRDQLSFAYTYQKLRRMNPDKPFYLHMFKDCERRAVAKLFRHRSDEKRNSLRQQATE